MPQLHEAVSAYRKGRVYGASPKNTVLIAYSMAIVACAEQDCSRAVQLINGLKLSLNTESQPELAEQLNALFDQCLTSLNRGNFDETIHVLSDLRTAWHEVLHTAHPSINQLI